jgi:hypothetical protein
MQATRSVVVVGVLLSALSLTAHADPKTHKRDCAKADATVRAVRVGDNKFAEFQYYSVGAAERIDCSEMPKKSNLPAILKPALAETMNKLQGVWMFNGYTTAVDKEDLHTYKYAAVTFFSDELKVDSREGNHADEVSDFPKSKHPEDDKAVLAGIKAKPGGAFTDKDIRKVSVISDWQDAGKRGGVYLQRASVVVGVYDAENKKCWTWNKITVTRPEKGGKPELDDIGTGVNEIKCDHLK